jgi:hypothetical protein
MKTQTSSAEVCEYCVLPVPVPTKGEQESEKDFARRKTQAILTRHGLDPVAIGGRHRVLHPLSFQGEMWISCRCGTAEMDVSRYPWTGEYQKAQPAE